jgi:hypothetical protein
MRRHGGPNTKTHRRLQSRERRSLRQRVRSPGAEPAVSMIGAPEEARRCRGPRCLSGEGAAGRSVAWARGSLSNVMCPQCGSARSISHNKSLKLTRLAGG